MKNRVVVIYDGDCPLCSNIVLKRKLEDEGLTLQLVDARSLPPAKLQAYRVQGYDLNRGMLVEADEVVYFGHDALHKLMEMGNHQTRLVRVLENVYVTLDCPRIYPGLVRARLALLRLLGRRPIDPH